MLRDRRHAEFARERECAKLLLDQNWRDKLIGDAAYLRSLMILGHGDAEARTELALLKMERDAPTDVRLRESRAWLQQRRP